jgi:hypothetical protein
MARKRKASEPAQTDMFAPAAVTCTALAVYAAPPMAIGRLLGWVYPGDVKVMYGQPYLITSAYGGRGGASIGKLGRGRDRLPDLADGLTLSW